LVERGGGFFLEDWLSALTLGGKEKTVEYRLLKKRGGVTKTKKGKRMIEPSGVLGFGWGQKKRHAEGEIRLSLIRKIEVEAKPS